MGQANHPGQVMLRRLLSVAICLLLLAACGQVNRSTDNTANSTAIAGTLQAINAQATAIIAGTQQAMDAQATPVIASPTALTGVLPTASPDIAGESFDRIIRFSGQEWRVKSSNTPVGPGPNYFSNSPESVWVDESGQLHLKLIHKDDRWYCAEVVTAEPLGYGSYQFKISKGAAGLDKNAVLGLFTWDTTAPQFHNREIDIELSRWGEEQGLNTQFVVQPWDRSGNRHRFAIDPQVDSSTQLFVWSPDNVQFLSFVGSAQSPLPNDILEQWSYTGSDTPPAGGPTNARINLWLLSGQPPSDGNEIEIVLVSFVFIPQALAK